MPAPTYQPGDKVYLDGSDIQTMHPSKKLAHRHLGPYVIECKVGPSAYKLKLPRSMGRLYPVFPIVKLFPAPPDPIPGRVSCPPPDPVLVHGDEQFEVEEIIDSRVFRRWLQYLVKWKGYGYEDNSWEYATDTNCLDLVEDFDRRHSNAPRQIRHATFNSLPFISPADATTSWRAGSSHP